MAYIVITTQTRPDKKIPFFKMDSDEESVRDSFIADGTLLFMDYTISDDGLNKIIEMTFASKEARDTFVEHPVLKAFNKKRISYHKATNITVSSESKEE